MPSLAVGGDAHAQTLAAPTIEQVVPGDQGLTVAWSAPADVDSTVEAYDVRVIRTDAPDKSDGNWTRLDDAWTQGDLDAVVTGLSNGVSYDIEVRAVTASTDGTWSTTSTGTPAEPGDTCATAAPLADGLPQAGALATSDDVDYLSFSVAARREFFVFTTGDVDTRGEIYSASATEPSFSNDDRGPSSGPLNFMLYGVLEAGSHCLRVSGVNNSTGMFTLQLRTLTETVERGHARTIAIGSTGHGVLSPPRRVQSTTVRDVDNFRVDVAVDSFVAIGSAGYVRNPTCVLYDSRHTEVARARDTALWPFTQQCGLRVRLDAGSYYLTIKDDTESGGLYWLTVDTAPEPGSTHTTAASLELGRLGGGTIATDTDVDYFRVDLDQPRRVMFRVFGASGLTADVLDANRAPVAMIHYPAIAEDQPCWSPLSSVNRSAARTIVGDLPSGTFYLRVQSASSTGRGQGNYLVVWQQPGEHQRLLDTCPSAPAGIADPFYGCAWHLDNTGQLGAGNVWDINIDDVWDTFKGADVNIAVVDDGLDYLHEDLRDNVDRAKNHSFTADGEVFDWSDRHGTRIAGVIAARDNGLGSRGIAPRATIYAYNSLRATSTVNAAAAMTLHAASTSISNHSYNFHGASPQRIASSWERAVETGLRDGDGGKGTLYVKSGGNEHPNQQSSHDEQTSHYGVVTACAVQASGKRRPSSELGSNLWVCAPVGGPKARLLTTTGFSRYRGTGGTSAAAAVVSGVAALVRSANPALTWRDVKLILAESARKNDPMDPGWAAGAAQYGSVGTYEFNHQYGFGVVDVKAAVTLAQGWTNVPTHLRTATGGSSRRRRVIPDTASPVSSQVSVATRIDFVEFVEVHLDLAAPLFAGLRIELVSPSGAVSQLSIPVVPPCPSRRNCGVGSWYRTGSARHLGEDPNGTWTLRITDEHSGGTSNALEEWRLKIYGHNSKPVQMPAPQLEASLSSLTATWVKAPNPGRSAITAYDVRHIRSDATDKSAANWTLIPAAAASTARSYELTELSIGVKHDVEVRAVNDVGPGP